MRFVSLFLAALLVSSVLAIPAHARPIGEEQQTALDLSPVDPVGGWTTTPTETTWWLKTDQAPFDIHTPGDLAAFNPRLSWDRPGYDSAAAVAADTGNAGWAGKGADMTGGLPLSILGVANDRVQFPAEGPLQDDLLLYGAQVELYMMCDGDFALGPDVALNYTAPDGSVVTIAAFSMGLGEGLPLPAGSVLSTLFGAFGDAGADPVFGAVSASAYTGTISLGDPERGTGRTIPAGSTIFLDIAPFAGPTCFLLYDSWNYDSHVLFHSDAARHRLWTANADDVPVPGFPAADQAGPDGRVLLVNHLQATPFPLGAQPNYDVEEMLDVWARCSATNSAGECTQYFREHRDFLQIRDDDTGALLLETLDVRGELSDSNPRDFTWELLDLTRAPVDAAGARSMSLTQYTIRYPADTETATYRAEIQSIGTPRVGAGDIGGGSGISWEITETFGIGVRDIALSLVDASALHDVLRGEATEFRVRVTNLGAQDDAISLSIPDPGQGWTATVDPSIVNLAPGKSTVVTVTIGTSDVANALRSFVVSAVSSFPEVDPATLVLQVRPVVQALDGVSIELVTDTINIPPGSETSFAATVINTGNHLSHFVLIPELPSDATGWGLTVTPLSVQLNAGAMKELRVTLSSPPELPDGTSFPIAVTAQHIDKAAVSDTAVATVNMIIRELFDALHLDSTVVRAQREIGDDPCVDPTVEVLGILCLEGGSLPDSDYDTTALHRIRVTNNGDVEQELKVEAFWNLPLTPDAEDHCEDRLGVDVVGSLIIFDDFDGVPDGWRFNYQDDVGNALPGSPQNNGELRRNNPSSGPPFSGYLQLQGPSAGNEPLIVPAGEAKDLFFEIGYLEGDVCPELPGELGPSEEVSSSFSPAAALTVRIESLSDAGLVRTADLVNRVEPQQAFVGLGQYAGAIHGVSIEPAAAEDTFKLAPEDGTVTFDLRAINKANELDDLIILVSDSEDDWTYEIEAIPGDHRPGTIVCDTPTNDNLRIRCPGIGIYDEVALRVHATPDNTVRVGDVADFEVIVESGDVPTIKDVLDLTARLAGQFAFEAELDANDLEVPRGDSVNIPFTITNTGTEPDVYSLGLISGPTGFAPQIGGPTEVFVPAGTHYTTFLRIDVPADAPLQERRWEIFIGSQHAEDIILDALATPIAASTLLLEPVESDVVVTEVIVPDRGVDFDVQFKAVTARDGSARDVTFTIDRQDLPRGWILRDPTSVTLPLLDIAGTTNVGATATFTVVAPDDAIGISKIPLRAYATTDHPTARSDATDLLLGLASTFGLEATVDPPLQVISPGDEVVYAINITNLGLSNDQVTMTFDLPAGWTQIGIQQPGTLRPLESKTVTVKFLAPSDVNPGHTVSIPVFLNSQGGVEASELLHLRATFGLLGLDAIYDGQALYLAPQESVDFIFRVQNTGNLPDDVALTPMIVTEGLETAAEVAANPDNIDLLVNQSKEIRITATTAADAPAGADIAIDLSAVSNTENPALSASDNATAFLHILDYRSFDMDADDVLEYAIDRNQDAGDGFEEFKENRSPGGQPTVALDMSQFLNRAARQSFTAQVVGDDGVTRDQLVFAIDGDGDGRRDHFLDTSQDGLPDVYIDPDAMVKEDLLVLRDVDADEVLDYFLSLDDDDDLDAVYNLRTGRFTNLLQLDVDGDGSLDYVVDSDGDGQRDGDETVLLSKLGTLVTIVKVDMTGNDQLDDVIDEDGDGRPDHFIPAGSNKGIDIVRKDVTGDGVLDWTYDADGDGRLDSYYNPQDGSVGTIDQAENFGELLKDYWYVLALFGLVTALFVVLVAVTRK